MRIISGYARGRKLKSPPTTDKAIRPTSDRAREALFSILGRRIPGSVTLDLFAGTGAFGLEALSRGARSACFVDFFPQALALIRHNIQVCMDAFAHHQPSAQNQQPVIGGDGEIVMAPTTLLIKHDLSRGLPRFPETTPFAAGFDLIFLDPPYSQGLALATLQTLAGNGLVQPQSLVVVEERAKETLPGQIGALTLTDRRNYGEAGFWFYQPSTDQCSP